jgi:hypothetical protein
MVSSRDALVTAGMGFRTNGSWGRRPGALCLFIPKGYRKDLSTWLLFTRLPSGHQDPRAPRLGQFGDCTGRTRVLTGRDRSRWSAWTAWTSMNKESPSRGEQPLLLPSMLMKTVTGIVN